jgi:predicted NBD/HSP70 family sugar kinase
MSLQALRRWIARHPVQWVLGVALGLTLTLGGAQMAAAAHEIAHAASVAHAQDLHATAGHDCPSCLAAAALGGAAPAPATVVLFAPHSQVSATLAVERRFTPRVTLPYASRAPPASPVITA